MTTPDITFTVNSDGTINEAVPPRPPTQEPPLPRLAGNRAKEAYDAMRRPQAASVYRMLKSRHEVGASWKELWALGESNEQWDVGPIVVWLRFHGCEVEARYDVVGGESRFYLVGVSGGG